MLCFPYKQYIHACKQILKCKKNKCYCFNGIDYGCLSLRITFKPKSFCSSSIHIFPPSQEAIRVNSMCDHNNPQTFNLLALRKKCVIFSFLLLPVRHRWFYSVQNEVFKLMLPNELVCANVKLRFIFIILYCSFLVFFWKQLSNCFALRTYAIHYTLFFIFGKRKGKRKLFCFAKLWYWNQLK